MTEVANKDLCADLYELSGWDSEVYFDKNGDLFYVGAADASDADPAYSLGFLLRKLPKWLEDGSCLLVSWSAVGSKDFEIGYWSFKDDNYTILEISKQWHGIGNGAKDGHNGKYLPLENVACKLAIELFKSGVLTKETV